MIIRLLLVAVVLLAVTLIVGAAAQQQQQPQLRKKTRPFQNMNFESFAIPAQLYGGIIFAGQKSRSDIAIPPDDYIELDQSTIPASAVNTAGFGFRVKNFTTSLHASGDLSWADWQRMIKGMIYTSGSADINEIQSMWFTLEIYEMMPADSGFTTGINPGPTRDLLGALDHCFAVRATHSNTDNAMKDVSISGLARTAIVDKSPVAEQYVGVMMTQIGSDMGWVSVTGTTIGKRVAARDGSGCGSICNWAVGQPNTTSGGAVRADRSGKWHSVTDWRTTRVRSFCGNYPVHQYLACSVDQSLDGGGYCTFNAMGSTSAPQSTMEPQTTSAPETRRATELPTTAPAPDSATTPAPQHKQSETPSNIQTPSPATEPPPMQTAAPPALVTLAPTAETQAPPNTPSPPAATANTSAQQAAGLRGNASSPEEMMKEEQSSRAGVIFGIGIAVLFVVLGGLFFLRNKIRSLSRGGSSSSQAKDANKNFSMEHSAADQELVESLLITL